MDNKTNTRRIGKFYISDFFLAQSEAEIVFTSLKFIPYRVEFLWDKKIMQYIGLSYLFDEIPFSEETPEYNIILHSERDPDTGQDGITLESVERVKPHDGPPVDLKL